MSKVTIIETNRIPEKISYGTLFKWKRPISNVDYGVCMICYEGAISLKSPAHVWNKIPFERFEEYRRNNEIEILPIGTKVIIEQE